MDYNAIVNGLNKIGCVLSVELKANGTYGAICVEAANDAYLESVNVKRKEFTPGKPYYNYVPPTRNYEAMCFRCVYENRIIHSYINVALYNAWMEVILLPLKSVKDGKGYLLFSYEMTPKVDAEKMADLSPEIAVEVIKTAVKLKETNDFQKTMNAIINDIRENCEANRCCILLTDFKNETCSVLCESVVGFEANIPDVASYIKQGFFKIVKTWDTLIAKSNCYIIHDAEELELLKEKNEIWYDSLKDAGVYSLVIYPLKANDETIGYIWATNFNKDNTLNIKAILEVTAFILAAEISNHLLFEKTKLLSDTDLLTGLLNRNAMNNRITAIVTGEESISGEFGVVFADLNGLKTVNDRDGHEEGDELLKAAADMLRNTFTDNEIFRVGGDEFFVIISDKNENEFNNLVLNLRKKTEASNFVKLAIGKCFGDSTLDIRKAMHIADEKMYEDKAKFYKAHPELQHRVVTK